MFFSMTDMLRRRPDFSLALRADFAVYEGIRGHHV